MEIKFIKEDEIFEICQECHDPKIIEIGNRKSRIIIIDDFYKNPKAVQELAYNLPSTNASHVVKNAPIYRSDIKLNLVHIEFYIKFLAKLYLNIEFEHKEPLSFTTNILSSDTKLSEFQVVPHLDSSDVMGIVYLNDPKNCKGGTGFYRHKETGIECFPQTMECYKKEKKYLQTLGINISDASELQNVIYKNRNNYDYFISDSNNDWDLIKMIPMRYNRLVLYEGSIFHSAYVKKDYYTEHNYRVNQVIEL